MYHWYLVIIANRRHTIAVIIRRCRAMMITKPLTHFETIDTMYERAFDKCIEEFKHHFSILLFFSFRQWQVFLLLYGLTRAFLCWFFLSEAFIRSLNFSLSIDQQKRKKRNECEKIPYICLTSANQMCLFNVHHWMIQFQTGIFQFSLDFWTGDIVCMKFYFPQPNPIKTEIISNECFLLNDRPTCYNHIRLPHT